MATCDDVITALGLERHHCESCHEDYDMGDPMCTLFAPDGREQEVCCDVKRAIDAKGISDAEVFAALGE